MNFIPSLQANYVPVPETFLRRAFSPEVSREELVVMLFLFTKTYGWNQEKGFLSLDDLVHETGLTREEAARGVSLALDQEFVLEMPLDASNPESPSMYLLNTMENRRFLEAYATASQDGARPLAPPSPGPASPTPEPAPGKARAPREKKRKPGPRPGASIGGTWEPDRPRAPETGTLEEPPDLEVVEDEVEAPGASPEVVASPAPPPESPAPPAPEAPPAAPGGDPSGAAPDDEPLADWGLGARTVEMVVRLLGRVPSKDERVRLQSLNATDGELIEAMGRLIEKQVSIYSSDLIVYEYEALKSAERRLQKDAARKQEAEDRQARQRECRKCDGLGYFFVGVSGIQECECRSQ